MEKRKKGYIKPFKENRSKRPAQNGPDKSEMIFGTRAIIEAIESGKEIEKLFIQRGLSNDLTKSLIKLCRDRQIPINNVPQEKLNKITKKNHQGAICYLSAINYASLDNVISSCYEKGKSPFLIVLDRVTDVRNFGAIARTAECAGVDAIVIPSRGSAQITSDAVKTSAGALHYIPVCREMNLKESLQYIKESGISIIACSEKGEKTVYESALDQPVALLMGAEEDGISGEYLKIADEMVKIPMLGNISSLNVSVATGIIIYEVIRQRQV